METQPECAVINIPNIIKTEQEAKPLQQHASESPKNKSGGGMRFLRVALFKMRGRSAKPTMALQVNNNNDDIDDGSKSTWGRFVGSMRPLHLQSTQSPRSSPDLPSSEYKKDCGGYVSDFVADEQEPYSPSPPISCYASAVGLSELVQNDEENEYKQEVIVEDSHVDGDGDWMIDAKAEDFIAQFYQEMKLQRLDSVDRRYVERSQRSLGWCTNHMHFPLH